MNIRTRIYGTSRPAAHPQEERPNSSDAPESKNRRDNRSTDRHRLSTEKVRVSLGGVSHEAELINVSGGGAMIAAKFTADPWDLLHLHLGENGTIECVVRWCKAGKLGVEFAHETRLDCSQDTQAALLREVIRRTCGEAPLTESPEESAKDLPSTGPGLGDHRRAKRHPLIWSGVLHFDGQSMPVRLRNISETGAMVQCTSGPAAGERVVLQLGDTVSVPASIGWATGDQLGLSFDAPFEMGQLSKSTPEVAPARWVRPAYLNRTEEYSSPWDPRWQRLSVGELEEELEGFLKR